MATLMPIPTFTLFYQQHDTTHDLAPYLISAAYTDHLTGESDELDLELEDTDGKWMGDWYPGKGDLLKFAIGYVGQPLLKCGSFEIDEIEFGDAPSTVTIRALSAGVSSGLRTKQSRAFEDTILADVVAKVARARGYTISGKIARIPIDRLTQNETDLAFLKRLGDTYGYAVKFHNKNLVFTDLASLKNAPSVLTLKRSDLHPGWRLRDQIRTVYKSGRLKRHDPGQKKTVNMAIYRDGQVIGHTTEDK